VGPLDERPILCFATQGHGHLDEVRIVELLAELDTEVFAFQHDHKARSALRLLRTARAERPPLIVMEGTGIAGGVAVMAAGAMFGVPYVVSSGDAVGPYLRLHSRLAATVGAIYERFLCRRAAGFIGWTPYLVGRALTFGSPRAMTAPGWARSAPAPGARERVRERLGVGSETLLAGLVGSIVLNRRFGYAYGVELVRAIRRVERADVAVCVVGDGSGLELLEELAGDDLGRRVFLTGRVPHEAVADHLAAFDLASLPQSVDGVGSFRYTTKLPEYLAAGLPIVTGQIPAGYDLDVGQTIRLPGPAPWSEEYVTALAELLERMTPDELARRRAAAARAGSGVFDADAQRARVSAFLRDILAGRGARS
jgi:hypothetical protein